MKTLKTVKSLIILIAFIGLFTSCAEEVTIQSQEDGSAPRIEFKISRNGVSHTLNSLENYDDKILKIPHDEAYSFELNVDDIGGIENMNIRLVDLEHEITSFATNPSGWLTNEEGSYKNYFYNHPSSSPDFTKFVGVGNWETAATPILYIVAFDRDLLITATDRAGNVSEIRIGVEIYGTDFEMQDI